MFFPKVYNTIGFVKTVGDGIVSIIGLQNICYGEMVQFSNKELGLVLNLETDKVSVIVLGKDTNILPGDVVARTFNLMNIEATDSLLGRVVDPLGEVLNDLLKDQSSFVKDFLNPRFSLDYYVNNSPAVLSAFEEIFLLYLDFKNFLQMSKKYTFFTCLRFYSISKKFLAYAEYTESPHNNIFLKEKNYKRFLEARAPSIISRTSVNSPMETGIKLLIVWCP
jgi:F0F1-type ATP synthase alpha subunit